tara:strand:- start:7878 stop:8666 length:789 start_codon:yes stop_codon:yes gene_type:complete
MPKDKVTYHFNSLDSRISSDSFRRYVTPQLRSMANEYYLLIKKVEPLSSDMIEVKKSYEKLSIKWDEWKSKCLTGGESCSKDLRKIYQEFVGVEENVGNLRGALSNLDSTRPASVDTVLAMYADISELSVIDTRLTHAIEEMLITIDTPYWSPSMLANDIDQALHRATIITGITFTRLLPSEISSDFEFVWQSFIHPIEKRVLRTNDDAFLMNRLEAYNNNWNSFHMKIAKSNKDVDRGVIQIVETMHNRWNNVLKVIMKRW